MRNASNSIATNSDNNPYHPPTAMNSTTLVWQPFIQKLKTGVLASLLCIQLIAIVFTAWTAVFDIFNFIRVSYVLLSLGVFTASVSLIARNRVGIAVGLSSAAVCMFCYFVINFVTVGRPLLTRSALNAADLIRPIALLYACAAIPVVVAIFLRHIRRHSRQCSESIRLTH